MTAREKTFENLIGFMVAAAALQSRSTNADEAAVGKVMHAHLLRHKASLRAKVTAPAFLSPVGKDPIARRPSRSR
jgi:hypothetical protein